ncbi:MAG TPA: hypothetical protein PLE19_18245 [Planctomycetota bacterium]|nr:hypothetical protein [Planctomycetota bacterium]HRR81790.1 hypothetical protein [Planctomycetota bacterium]HRT94067.1 hypothetical protein [Planctomycetota bacterium]
MGDFGIDVGVYTATQALNSNARGNFRPGQAVRIRSGFLEGASGRVLMERHPHRVLLEVELRERTVVADVAADDVEKTE